MFRFSDCAVFNLKTPKQR